MLKSFKIFVFLTDSSTRSSFMTENGVRRLSSLIRLMQVGEIKLEVLGYLVDGSGGTAEVDIMDRLRAPDKVMSL